MRATYAYRTRADGVIHHEPFDTFWKALNRAEYDVDQNSSAVEPLSITVADSVFDWGHIRILLDH